MISQMASFCGHMKQKTQLNEILWGNNWPIRIQFVADGKIYLAHGEHSPVDPKPRGGPMICVDAETGEEIWSMSMYYYYRTNVVIGDNIIAVMNSYDQQVYAIGKGPSGTTVSIQDDVVTNGDSVLMKGMVTDISPGTEKYALTARFPDGVPAVSNESMCAWMEYVYMQMPKPQNATGVPVELFVIDANNNYRSIGTTNRLNKDSTLPMDTDISGKYTVYAKLQAANPTGHHRQQHVAVVEVEATTAPTETPPQSRPILHSSNRRHIHSNHLTRRSDGTNAKKTRVNGTKQNLFFPFFSPKMQWKIVG